MTHFPVTEKSDAERLQMLLRFPNTSHSLIWPLTFVAVRIRPVAAALLALVEEALVVAALTTTEVACTRRVSVLTII